MHFDATETNFAVQKGFNTLEPYFIRAGSFFGDLKFWNNFLFIYLVTSICMLEIFSILIFLCLHGKKIFINKMNEHFLLGHFCHNIQSLMSSLSKLVTKINFLLSVSLALVSMTKRQSVCKSLSKQKVDQMCNNRSF